nr:odorant binding protein 5 [Monochamus saltuarius]
MKFAVAIVCLVVVAAARANLTEEQIEKLKGYHKDCAGETGVDTGLVTKARKGEFSDDPKFKEHLFCVAKKIGFMTADGEIQKDVLKAKLGPAINDDAAAQQLIDECAVKKDTPQDTAFETIQCYYVKTPTHISIV